MEWTEPERYPLPPDAVIVSTDIREIAHGRYGAEVVFRLPGVPADQEIWRLGFETSNDAVAWVLRKVDGKQWVKKQ
jgi:hypothetical protein